MGNFMRRLYSFGSFNLHTNPYDLREGRRTVHLSSRQLEVLALIVRAQGAIVPKEAFFKRVWQGAFVEEGNLTQTIFVIRKTLGKLASGAEYIETVSRHGYRLAAAAMRPLEEDELVELGDDGTLRGVSDVLRESERFRLLMNSVEDIAIYMLDCTGRVLTCNRGAEKMQGYDSHEVVGQHCSLFFAPEDVADRVPERELAVAGRKGKCSGEGWRIKRSGERFWASCVTTAVRDPSGKLIGFSKVVHDLSERKRQEDIQLRMESVLRRERDRLQAAAESSTDALYICEAIRDTQGEIEDFVFTYLNGNVEKIFEIERGLMLGKRMCDVLPKDHALGFLEAYRQVVVSGNPFEAEVPIHPDDGTSRWVRVRAVPFEDGIVLTASDITERNCAEERNRQLTLALRVLTIVKIDPLVSPSSCSSIDGGAVRV